MATDPCLPNTASYNVNKKAASAKYSLEGEKAASAKHGLEGRAALLPVLVSQSCWTMQRCDLRSHTSEAQGIFNDDSKAVILNRTPVKHRGFLMMQQSCDLRSHTSEAQGPHNDGSKAVT